ncbi:MAG TPA: biotin/lipoyl-containing protein, partial [Gallionella sp.]|nr:biotin/lipoyl-containing protein [Gallionella sp.]
MSIIEVRVPQLSESVSEATLLTWHKQVGEAVSEGENLIDVETDKVVLELPASRSGVLVKIIKGDGEKVGSEELIAQIDTAAVAQKTPSPLKGALKAGNPLSAKVDAELSQGGGEGGKNQPAVPPSVRKLAR